MKEAQHKDGRAFRLGEIAGAKGIADAASAKTVTEQVAAIDADRPIACECECESIGIHNQKAQDHNKGSRVRWQAAFS